ncbi:hypothetical protein BH753_gp065 [Bacillus phage Shbh1]|uniref:Uncharacterized protein n=1 Tax=Bacillus phage Shbh1 TaxID=1796992 RepID=A0A142F190_9CAUD|nr:hypothetical protein BH753_gp065 [Bacillus phage Shbh1]AMQ66547.1 hypothetical protein [Bacillus phage Shbh1]
MNALQATIKLERLKDEISALDLAVVTMKDKDVDSYSIQIVSELKESKIVHQKDLENILKDTVLDYEF